eukprot:Gb_02196 [translate_table: standard]
MSEKGEMGVTETEKKESGTAPEVQRRPFETLLRIVPIGLCIAALVLMLQSKQSNDNGPLEYSHVGAFKYLAYTNGLCAGYSVLSVFDSAARRSFSLCRAWIVFFFDQAFTYVLLAAGAVATEVLYLAYEGDEEVTWDKVCASYGRFCNRAGASLVISFVALLCFVLLSIVSAHRLFSKYDPPSLLRQNETINQT